MIIQRNYPKTQCVIRSVQMFLSFFWIGSRLNLLTADRIAHHISLKILAMHGSQMYIKQLKNYRIEFEQNM